MDLDFLKVIRMMRILRPLRFISRNKELKFIVIALTESFEGVFNVIVIMFLFWIMLAIMGINFLKNKMGYCSSSSFSSHYNVSKQQCLKNVDSEGNGWKRYPWNMDNIIYSILTIFVLSTLEGWNEITYTFIDSNSEDIGPIYDNRMMMLFYSIFIIYMCSFFLQNLFIGIIFLNYVIAE